MGNKVTIRVRDLGVDHEYQRREVQSVVEVIVKNYDPDSLGALIVGKRKDGTLWIVDGQQRWNALKRLGIEEVECCVFPSRGPKHEAVKFHRVNTQKRNLNDYDKFHADRCGGLRNAPEVDELVVSCGFKIVPNTSKSTTNLSCVAQLRRLYNKDDGKSLGIALQLIYEEWAELKVEGANVSKVVAGVGELVANHYDQLDIDRLRQIMQRIPPKKLMLLADNAAAGKSDKGSGRYKWVELVLKQKYNSKLSQKRKLK